MLTNWLDIIHAKALFENLKIKNFLFQIILK